MCFHFEFIPEQQYHSYNVCSVYLVDKWLPRLSVQRQFVHSCSPHYQNLRITGIIQVIINIYDYSISGRQWKWHTWIKKVVINFLTAWKRCVIDNLSMGAIFIRVSLCRIPSQLKPDIYKVMSSHKSTIWTSYDDTNINVIYEKHYDAYQILHEKTLSSTRQFACNCNRFC